MSKKASPALPKIKRGHFLVWYGFESLLESLGSYCGAEDLANGEERTIGHPTLKKAIQAANDNYKDDPIGPGDFKIINSQMEVVYKSG